MTLTPGIALPGWYLGSDIGGEAPGDWECVELPPGTFKS